MSELKIDAQSRDITRRKTRQLRREGLVPVVLYGPATEAVNLQVNSRSLDRLLHMGAYSQLVTLDVEGGDVHNVLVREVQRDPVSHAYVHADFYAVDMSQLQQVSVTVNAVGEPAELVTGLMMYQAMDQVEISALPSAIPASISVDVTNLTLENSVNISDLPDLEGVTYMSDPGESVFTIITTRVEEEEEEEIEELGLEPEVVGRGGEDEDADEAEDEE